MTHHWEHTSTAWGLVIQTYVTVNKEWKMYITSFVFECTRYRAARKILLQTITSICDDAECKRRVLMTVSALLNPEELQIFTKKTVSADFDSCVCVYKTVRSTSVTIQQSEDIQKDKNWNNKTRKINLSSVDLDQLSVKLVTSVDLQEDRSIKSWKLVLRDRNRRTNKPT